MSDDLHNLDDVLEELEKKAITTTQGSFFKKEDVVELIERRKKANAVDLASAPKPKTLEAAREGAKKFLKEALGDEANGPREPGRSISAQPSSRT